MADQPTPLPNNSPAIWDLVIEDMRQRDRIGRERYGTPLQAGNGRDALRDMYEELLDAAVYAKQAIIERDALQDRISFLEEVEEQRKEAAALHPLAGKLVYRDAQGELHVWKG